MQNKKKTTGKKRQTKTEEKNTKRRTGMEKTHQKKNTGAKRQNGKQRAEEEIIIMRGRRTRIRRRRKWGR